MLMYTFFSLSNMVKYTIIIEGRVFMAASYACNLNRVWAEDIFDQEWQRFYAFYDVLGPL